MPIDELAEGVLKGLFRFAGRILYELFFEAICHGVGRVFLKIVSLGRYPKDHFGDESDWVCSLVGVGVIIAGIWLGVSIFAG